MKINPRVVVVREAISKIVEMLAIKQIKVRQSGMQAYVRSDRKTGTPELVNLPYMPDDATDELIDAVQGFLDHEVAHLLFTDFLALGKIPPGQKAYLTNVIEDTFIEREMANRFAGSGHNLARVGSFVLDKLIAPAYEKSRNPMDLVVPIIRAAAGQAVFRDFVNKHPECEPILKALGPDFERKVRAIKSTADSIALAGEIFKDLKEAAQKAAGDPDKECDGGKGKGEKKAKSDKGKPDKEAGGKKAKAEKPEAEEEEPGPTEDDLEEDMEAGADESDPDEEEGDEGEGEPTAGEEEDDEGAGSDSAAGDESEDEDEDDAASKTKGDGEDEGDSDDDGPGEGVKDAGAEEGDEPSGDKEVEGKGGKKGKKERDLSKTPEHERTFGDDKEPEISTEDGGDTDGEFIGAPGSEDHSIVLSKEEKEEGELAEKMLKAMEEAKDFDALASEAIKEVTLESSGGSDYLVWSTDYDVVEPIKVPDLDEPSFKAADEQMQENVDHMVGPMQKDLERAVAARSAAVWTAGHRSGKLHGASLARIATGRDDLFRRKQVNTTKDVAVQLVVDGSGSMRDKIQTASYAAYALSSTLDRLNIVNDVVAFTTKQFPHAVESDMVRDLKELRAKGGRDTYSRVEALYMPVIKEFHERMTPAIRGRFVALSNFFYGGLKNNVDGESVQLAYRRLIKRREARKILIVLSDGYPAAFGAMSDLEPHLKAVVNQIQLSGVDVVGIGIRSNAVEKFYPKSVVLNDVADLPGTVMQRLKEMLLV
jgi:hypothetical protein